MPDSVIVFQLQVALDLLQLLPSGVLVGIPLQSVDGRVAICHPFSEDDLAEFRGMAGVQVLDGLSGDWQWPTDV